MSYRHNFLVAFKMSIISVRKHIVDIDIVSDITCVRQRVITHVVIRFL